MRAIVFRTLFFAAISVLEFSPMAANAQGWLKTTPRQSQQIPSNTGTWISYPNVTLVNGMRYSVHSTGFVTTSSGSNDGADAHYYYASSFPIPSGTALVGIQVLYDGTNSDYLQQRYASLPSSSHDYTNSIPSTGAALSFRFFDTKEPPDIRYTDNSGQITIEVAQETPQLAVKDTVLEFGNVDFRAPHSLLDSIESYGTATSTIDSAAIVGSTDFQITSAERGLGSFYLAERQTNAYQITFHPTKLGGQTAYLHIYSASAFFKSDRDRVIVLHGTGHGPIVVPVIDTTHFQIVKPGGSKSLPVRFVNLGDTAATITSVTFNPTTPFSTTDFKTLLPGDTTNVLVTFAPPVQAHYLNAGDLVLDNGWKLVRFYVDGDGMLGNAVVTPLVVDFGTVVFGDKRTKGVRITNITSVPVSVTLVGCSNSKEFAVTGRQGPYTLDTLNASEFYNVTFTPIDTLTVPHTATLTFTFGDGEPPISVALSGNNHIPIHGTLSIGRTYFGVPDSVITIVQNVVTSFDSSLDSITYFNETISFDPAILTFIDLKGGALLVTPDWNILPIQVVIPGRLDIHASSTKRAVHGPGELLRLTFRVNHGTLHGQSTELIQSGMIFGNGFEPLMNSRPGLFNVANDCSPIYVSASTITTGIEPARPNPVSSQGAITYHVQDMSGGAHIQLRLYNALGSCVATLVDANVINGTYDAPLSAAGLAAGLYTCVLDAGPVHRTERIVIAR